MIFGVVLFELALVNKIFPIKRYAAARARRMKGMKRGSALLALDFLLLYSCTVYGDLLFWGDGWIAESVFGALFLECLARFALNR